MTSQLETLCAKLNIRATATYGQVPIPPTMSADMHPWLVTLYFGRRRLTAPFFTGSAHTEDPTAADVLSCLVSDALAGEQDFAGFCADFGYDVDSRRAHDTWEACKKAGPRVRRFLGKHFEAVQSAED